MTATKLTPGYVTLRYIVSSFLNEIGQDNKKGWRRYGQLAIDCYVDELSGKILKSMAIHEAEINSGFTIPLPQDFIDYSTIFVILNGKMWTLGRNKKIALVAPVVDECSCTVEDVLNGVAQAPQAGYPIGNYGNSVMSHHFGHGGGFNINYFKVDRAKREVRFESLMPGTKVYIEYKSTGLNMLTGVVDRMYLPTIKAYLNWKRVENDKRESLGEKDRKFITYYNSKKTLAERDNAFRTDEFLDELNERQSQTIER